MIDLEQDKSGKVVAESKETFTRTDAIKRFFYNLPDYASNRFFLLVSVPLIYYGIEIGFTGGISDKHLATAFRTFVVAFIWLTLFGLALKVKDELESIFKRIIESEVYEKVLAKAIPLSLYERLLDVKPDKYLLNLRKEANNDMRAFLEKNIEINIERFKKCNDSLTFNISSAELYFLILKSIEGRHATFKIIDHDITRWEELILEDKKSHPLNSTFNYSRDILKYIRARGSIAEGTKFGLKRIFMITLKEWKQLVGTSCSDVDKECEIGQCGASCEVPDQIKRLSDQKDENKLLEIIKKIKEDEQYIFKKSNLQSVETRICVYDWLEKLMKPIANDVIEMKDIVIVNESFIFREYFYIEDRKVSIDTISEISGDPNDIKRGIDLFDNIWNNYTKII